MKCENFDFLHLLTTSMIWSMKQSASKHLMIIEYLEDWNFKLLFKDLNFVLEKWQANSSKKINSFWQASNQSRNAFISSNGLQLILQAASRSLMLGQLCFLYMETRTERTEEHSFHFSWSRRSSHWCKYKCVLVSLKSTEHGFSLKSTGWLCCFLPGKKSYCYKNWSVYLMYRRR